MFGKVQQIPQDENTPFYPRSPYGVAKLASHWLVKNYREAYSVFGCSGILFNHESPRRGKDFVTQKIVHGLINIMKGCKNYIELGNLDAKRDWGHAKDYVYGMWLILQQSSADDYVIATGETRSVREFAESVIRHFDDEIIWSGEGVNEVGILKSSSEIIIKVSPAFYRPCEVELLVGNCSKIKQIGWKTTFSFDELVSDMINNVSL
jgi:GDPmannose 4,6-dehydratase